MINGLTGMQAKYDLAGVIIGCAIEVHRHLGPGLLETPYERCLAREMTLQHIPYRRQEGLSIVYKGETVESAYIPDFIVDNKVIVEVKAVSKLVDIHKQQLMTYLKLSRCE